jgi:predicted O-methyltransferase YrrM
MIQKLKTLFWYFKQPGGAALVKNLFLQKTLHISKENTAAASISWCREKALSTSEAIEKLTGKPAPKNDIHQLFPDEFMYAEKKIKETPFSLGGAGNMQMLYDCCEILQAKNVLETGVAYGWSSLAILLSLHKRPGSKLVSTDMPYAKMGNENVVGIVVPQPLRTNWVLIPEADNTAIPKALKILDSADVIHYDSDKSYLGRMHFYPVLYKLLRKGGLFISDDLQDNVAFRDYCNLIKVDPVVISFDNKYIGLFIK